MATRQEKKLLNNTIEQINSSNVLSPRDKQILADALDRLSKSPVTSAVVRKKKINQTQNRKNLRFNTSNRTDCSTLSLQQCPEVEFLAYGSFVSSGACYDPVADPNDPYSNHESHCPKLCQFAPTGNWGAREGIGAWARWIEEEGRHENCQEATTTSNNPEIISSVNGSDVTSLWESPNGISTLIIQGACIDEENQTCGPYINADGDEINPCAEESPFAPDGVYILNNCEQGQIPSTHVYHYEDVCCANDISYCVIPCTGDVDFNGEVNVADIVLIVNNVLGNNTFSELQNCAGDINQDTVVNVIDIVNIVQVILYGGEFENNCEAPVYGCTDPNACNYNSQATVTDNSCQYQTTLQDCTINNENCNTIYTEASETHDCNGVCINPNPCCGYENWSEDCEFGYPYPEGCGTPQGFDCSDYNLCPDDGVTLVCGYIDCSPKIICPDNITEVCDENDCPDIDDTIVDNTDFIQINDIDISETTVTISGSITDVGDDYSGSYTVEIDWGDGAPAQSVSLNENLEFNKEKTYGEYLTNQQITINLTGDNVSDSLTLTLDIPEPEIIYGSEFIEVNNIQVNSTNKTITFDVVAQDDGAGNDDFYGVLLGWSTDFSDVVGGNPTPDNGIVENYGDVISNDTPTTFSAQYNSFGNKEIYLAIYGDDNQLVDDINLNIEIPAPLQPDPISASEKLYISDVSITDDDSNGTYDVTIKAGYIDVDEIYEEYKIYIKFPKENDDGYYTYSSNSNPFTNNPSYQYSIPGEKEIVVELINQDTNIEEDSLTITIDIPEPEQLPGEDLPTNVNACNDTEACNYNLLCGNDNINCTNDGSCYYPSICLTGEELCPQDCPEVIFGCTYSDALNYDETANVDNNTCEFEEETEPEPEPELPEAAIAQPFKLLEPDIITSNCTTPPYIPINGERVFCEAQGLINRLLPHSDPFLPNYGCSDYDFDTDGNLNDATLIRLFRIESGLKRIYFLWEEGDNTGNVDNFFITVQQGSDTILDEYEFYEPVAEEIDPTRSNRTTNAASDIIRENNLHIGSFDNELGYSKIYYVSIPVEYFDYPDFVSEWNAGDRIRWEVKLKVTGGDTIYGESACADFTPQSNHQANFYVADVHNNKIGCINDTASNYNPSATSDLNYNIENEEFLCRDIVSSEPVDGCTDVHSTNYNPLANQDDGSCCGAVWYCNFDSTHDTDDSGVFTYHDLFNTGYYHDSFEKTPPFHDEVGEYRKWIVGSRAGVRFNTINNAANYSYNANIHYFQERHAYIENDKLKLGVSPIISWINAGNSDRFNNSALITTFKLETQNLDFNNTNKIIINYELPNTWFNDNDYNQQLITNELNPKIELTILTAKQIIDQLNLSGDLNASNSVVSNCTSDLNVQNEVVPSIFIQQYNVLENNQFNFDGDRNFIAAGECYDSSYNYSSYSRTATFNSPLTNESLGVDIIEYNYDDLLVNNTLEISFTPSQLINSNNIQYSQNDDDGPLYVVINFSSDWPYSPSSGTLFNPFYTEWHVENGFSSTNDAPKKTINIIDVTSIRHTILSYDCTGTLNGTAQYDSFCGRDRILGSCNPGECNVLEENGGENCNCVCTGGNTGIESFETLGINNEGGVDNCNQCWGAWAEDTNVIFEIYGITTYENDNDLGCGCGQEKPILHFLDADNDAYIGNPYDGGTPNQSGEVNATVKYYFCLYENNNDITFAYDEIIEYDDSRGRTLLEPPNLTFNYPEYIPPMDNYVPDWVDLGNDFTFEPGNIDLPGPENWYNDGTFDTPAGEGGGVIISIGGCIDPEALNYNPAVDYDNGTCQYPTPPLAETNLPIVRITETNVEIYKSELDEQVTISPEFLIFEGSLGAPTGQQGMLQINTSYETFGNNNGNLNLPFSNSINLIPLIDNYPDSGFNTIDDYTLSKTALTHNLFDIMSNEIVDFKFVDVEWDGSYFGTHLFYPEPSLSVFGYELSDELPVAEPGIYINEFSSKNGYNGVDFVEMWNNSGEQIDLQGWIIQDSSASNMIITSKIVEDGEFVLFYRNADIENIPGWGSEAIVDNDGNIQFSFGLGGSETITILKSPFSSYSGYIDEVSYTSHAGMGSGQSYARIFDGVGISGALQGSGNDDGWEIKTSDKITPGKKNYVQPALFKFDNNETDGFVKIEGEDVDITNLTNPGNLSNLPLYEDFASVVNINSYLDYVLLQELRMGDGSLNNFNYDNVYVVYDGEQFNFGPFDFLENTNGFINGFDVNFCQDEEYKVNDTTNKSQGWLFDNIETANLLSSQLKSFVSNDEFVIDLVTRWNELRGDVLSDENILQRIEYYFYYLKNRADVNYQINNYTSSTFEEEIESLKTWITNRIYWIDHNIRRIKYQTEEPDPSCSGSSLLPTGITGNIGDFCNDPEANNYNSDSNFNDGTCEYDFLRLHEFILNTTDTSYPPIDSVRLNILSINNIEINVSYEMNETINNIWSYEYFDFMPGDVIEYNYTKQTPDVYNVATGPLETDKIRRLIIKDENQREIQNTFNDFINEFQETNLPIIKINTNTFNDIGFVDDNNPNLFYCPSYLLPSGYFADGPPEEICDMMKDYIDWHDDGKPVESEDFPEGNPGGYYTSKILCEAQTNCTVECIDGTNIQDEPKIAGYFELIYNGEGAINNINDEPQLETRIGIEARGYSSRGFAKKQYAVELQDMTKIFPQCDDENISFGLFCDGFKPEPGVDYGDECLFNREDDFVLLGPFRDRTYMRNAITYELWERMGNIGTNSKFFEFILNDTYMGLYVMFEKPKIDRHRVPIDVEIDDNSSVNNGYDGGWMLKVESGAEQDFFVGYDSYTKYEYYDPSLEITGDEDDAEIEFARQKIQSTVKDFEERIIELGEYPVSVPELCQGQYLVTEDVYEDCQTYYDQEGTCPEDCTFSAAVIVQSVEEYFEINNFVDYWLLQEFARNNEGYTRSQYWHSFGNASEYGPFDSSPEQNPIYDDNKIYLSFIWDMNHSFAATIVETDGWAIQNFFAVPQIWGNLFQQTWFAQAVYDRYVEIKNTIPIFDVGEINKLINKFSSELQQFNAVSRDQKRWFEGNVDEFDIYIKNLRKYILQRISWMDIHICPGEGQAFISSDEEHQLFYPTEGGFQTCEEDAKNSNFVAIYNPFEGQVFDYDTLDNFIEIEIIVSLNLFRLLQQFGTGSLIIRVTIQDELTNSNVEVFDNIGGTEGILIDNKGYVKLNWDISNLKQIDKLIGNYNITADIVGSNLPLDESVKRFSIQRVGKVSGCTDSFAVNYDLFAEVDDGSCKYLTDCNIKYGTSEFITDIIELAPGYNTISYPIDFSGTDLDLFNILNFSYYNADDDQPGNFQHNDYIIAFFNDGIYTATYMKDNNNQNGKWIKTTNKGFNLNEISKGIGFMIHVRDGGRIIWNIPREELRQ